MASPTIGVLDAGVIDAARARQRRHRALAVVIAAALAFSSVVIGASRGPHDTPVVGARDAALRVAPSVVLARTPYMGVVCPIANSTLCDRVGLAVWLRKSAVAVSATIGGRPLTLNTQQARPFLGPEERAGTMFVGYLHPAGIAERLRVIPDDSPIGWWAPSANNAPSPPVELRIDYGNGRPVVTKLYVPLEAGWG
jgi:hypothetical protein